MRKKLIIISYDFPPLDGGIARLCQEIASGQADFFDQVTVLTTDKAGESITYNYTSVERIEFPSKRGRCEYTMIKYLRAIPNKSQYILLTATWHPEGFIALLSGFKNIYFLAHGTELLSGVSWFRKNVWLRFYAYLSLAKANAVICNSSYTAGLVRSIQPRSHAISLPLAVNTDFFFPKNSVEIPSRGLRIATVSRIEKFKGHDFIARTIANLPINIRQGIHWNIAGKGPDLEYIKKLISELKLDAQVTFWGFVADDQLPDFYNENDVFVLCSRESKDTIKVEGFGLVFLEAQACGVAAIGTRTGGIIDAISHEHGGWLIDQDNEQQLSGLLVRLSTDNGYLKEQRKLARERVLNGFQWSTYNNSLHHILTSRK